MISQAEATLALALGDGNSAHNIGDLPGIQQLLASHPDGAIRILNVEDGMQEGTSMVYGMWSIGSLAVTRGGMKMTSNTRDRKVGLKIWDVDSHTVVKEPEWTHVTSHVDLHPNINSIHPGDQLVAVTLHHLDRTGIKCSIKFGGEVNPSCFSLDEHKLPCITAHKLYIFDAERVKYIFRGPVQLRNSSEARAVVLWSLNGRNLFSAWSDGIICCFNPDAGELIEQVLLGHTHDQATTSLSLFPDGLKLASSSWDTICFRDATSGNTIEKYPQRIRKVCFSPSGDFAAPGVDSNSICVWRVTWSELVENQVITHETFFNTSTHSFPSLQTSPPFLDVCYSRRYTDIHLIMP